MALRNDQGIVLRSYPFGEADRVVVLRDAVVAQIKLRRAADDLRAIANLLPMCAWCRKVRTGQDESDISAWRPLHEYVADLNPVSHGICPGCQESFSVTPR